MGDPDQDGRPIGDPSDRPGRQRYEKPAVSWEESLEVRPALTTSCSKISGSGEPCNSAAAS
jgi:hypothetical protein